MKERIIRLIRVIGEPYEDLIFEFYLSGNLYDGVSVSDDGSDYLLFSHKQHLLLSNLYIPENEFEFWTTSDMLNEDQEAELIIVLENILLD